jgi:hypothetical protein
MGAFLPGEDGSLFSEPEPEFFSPALTNGFLTDAVFGPVTLQLLLAPNYSKESASTFASGILADMALMYGSTAVAVDAEARFFRIGGRVIADVGVGTIAAVFKTFQWPSAVENGVGKVLLNDPTYVAFSGSKESYHTFGAYFDLTAVENLGVSLGYTGFLPTHDAEGVDNVLYSGIDLRATWTGIEGLSLSTHNNISFAQGAENDWFILSGKDSSFFSLYNAIGMTKELNDRFSINAEVSNILAKTDLGAVGELEYDNFAVSAKFIAKAGDNAEFNIGAKLDIAKTTASGIYGSTDESVTTFSVPVGIVLSF